MSKVFNMVGGGGGPAASIFVTGLSQTDTVTATKGAKTLTGKWTQRQNPASHGLPDGYTELEYIESTDQQYINTEFYPGPTNNIEIEFSLSGPLTAQQTFYGARFTSSKMYVLAVYSKGAVAAFYSGNSIESIIQSSDGLISYGKKYKIKSIVKPGSQKLYLDDVEVASGTYSEATVSTQPAYLLGWNAEGSIDRNCTIRIHRAKLDTARDFIPVKRNSDGAVGMYDLVSNTFFGNSGTGEFVAGPEVPQTFDYFLIKPIRDFGTWTVTATNGTKTVTQDVLVDAITNYEIEIDLTKLWLYREGDERIDVTGGWTDSGYSSNESIYTVLPASKQSGYVLFKTNGLARIFALGTINKINLTGYKKLYVDFDNTYTNIGAIYTLFGRAASDKILYTDEQYSLSNTTGRQVVSVDISSIEGNNYIMFYLFGYSGNGTKYASTNLYNVWLE